MPANMTHSMRNGDITCKVLELIHPDLVSVLVSLIDLWVGTVIGKIFAAKDKEIEHSIGGVYLWVDVVLMLRSEFSGVDRVKIECVGV